ncbi:alpha-glucosidase [Acholeplasma equirhinis]|uniref:alpha-glucosidase n=1 Tax=Acholeplasma equirhinis TaxID=555393 RepID=UPI00197A955D|nr:alpha-glucosidase [Acholeplasma equirhinis]MBN3490110.1 alpha-glucosidase [Acholeplasma equirhinis]
MNHQNTWWKQGFFYQLYPRSFMDSNHDGIGDIRGIISKIDYLKQLGIKAIWLNPVYQSPNDDMGYDISNYNEVMTEFGTKEDLKELIDLLHQNGIKLVMDLVVNHTSDEHQWFIESRKSKDNPYRDFYIWRDNHNNQPPNNWSSFFTPSAWKLDTLTNSWYLHLFSEKQPDLNWENESMRRAIYAMINRWFDFGVDGFRMDVITLIAKNPKLPDGNRFFNDHGYSMAFENYALQPKMYDYLQELKENTARPHTMYLGEATFANQSNAHTLIGDDKPMDLIFQFDLMDVDSGKHKFDVIPIDYNRFKRTLFDWQKAIPWNTLFLCNHDQARSVSRFGNTSNESLWNRSAKMLGVAIHLMKGTSFIYQGEEIGMTNSRFEDPKELKDIESINYYKLSQEQGHEAIAWEGILKKARDHARTPIQWNGLDYAGFSTVEPWMKVNQNYHEINVQKQQNDPNSILNFYRKLIQLKTNSVTLTYGDVIEIETNIKSLLIYKRVLENEEYLIICNLSNEIHRLDFSLKGYQLVLSNMLHSGYELESYVAYVYRKVS